MNNSLWVTVAAGLVASGLVGGMALAQDESMQQITVQGTRLVTTKLAGKTPSGVPVSDVSLGYGVVVSGLNLASHADFLEAEKRVKDVAQTACKELVRRYPDGTPSESECVKAATDKAMIVLNGWAARASKAAAK